MCVPTDVSMPGIDGFELARRQRSDYGSTLVLIAVTDWGDPNDRAAPRFADFDFRLRKPLDIRHLRNILPPGR
jgi:CheY-like chemotaxis protein